MDVRMCWCLHPHQAWMLLALHLRYADAVRLHVLRVTVASLEPGIGLLLLIFCLIHDG